MIDLTSIFFHCLWVAGLSLLLATLGYSDWQAAEQRSRTRAILATRGPSLLLHTGFLLFCVGLLGTSSYWLERAGWGLLSLLTLAQAIQTARQRPSSSEVALADD